MWWANGDGRRLGRRGGRGEGVLDYVGSAVGESVESGSERAGRSVRAGRPKRLSLSSGQARPAVGTWRVVCGWGGRKIIADGLLRREAVRLAASLSAKEPRRGYAAQPDLLAQENLKRALSASISVEMYRWAGNAARGGPCRHCGLMHTSDNGRSCFNHHRCGRLWYDNSEPLSASP